MVDKTHDGNLPEIGESPITRTRKSSGYADLPSGVVRVEGKLEYPEHEEYLGEDKSI